MIRARPWEMPKLLRILSDDESRLENENISEIYTFLTNLQQAIPPTHFFIQQKIITEAFFLNKRKNHSRINSEQSLLIKSALDQIVTQLENDVIQPADTKELIVRNYTTLFFYFGKILLTDQETRL